MQGDELSIPLQTLNPSAMPGSESHLPGHKRLAGMEPSSRWATAQRLWRLSLGPDYIAFAVLFTLYILLQSLVTPFYRLFSLSDPRIQFPHALDQRVPVAWLFIYGGGVPLLLITLWLVSVRCTPRKLHIILLGLAVNLILTLFLTDVFKNAIGRPRPDLISRCKPAPGTPTDVLVSIEVCTQPSGHTLHDGWRSFPSGHSSFAFSGLTYLSLFFASQTAALRAPTDLSRTLLVLAPLLGAAMIAISRLQDYRHDVGDVTMGSILGIVVAWTTWRRNFPALTSERCDTPVVLLEDERKGAWRRVRDEEGGFGEGEASDVDV